MAVIQLSAELASCHSIRMSEAMPSGSAATCTRRNSSATTSGVNCAVLLVLMAVDVRLGFPLSS